MKKHSIITIILFSLLLMVASCQKAEPKAADSEMEEAITVIASFEKPDSKVAPSEGDINTKLGWNKNDLIYGYWQEEGSEEKNVVAYKAKIDGAAGGSVEFEPVGTVPVPASGQKAQYYMVYNPTVTVNNYSPSDVLGNGFRIDGLSVQNGDYKNYLHLCATASLSGNKLSLLFGNQFSIIKISKIEDCKAGSYDISFEAPGFPSSGNIEITDSGFHFVPDENSGITYTIENCSPESGEMGPFYIVFPMGKELQNVADNERLAVIVSDHSNGSKVLLDKKFDAAFLYRSMQYEIKRITLKPRVLDGVFSVSDTKKVRFSRGNLYCDGSSWDFERQQHEFHTAVGYDCYVDGAFGVTRQNEWGLFAWSTPGTNYGRIQTDSSNIDPTGFEDWAHRVGGQWRTLTAAEWTYLTEHDNQNSVRYRKSVKVRLKYPDSGKPDNYDRYGLLLFPDDITSGPNIGNSGITEFDILTSITSTSQDVPDNCVIDQARLLYLEEKYGAVFLPSCGFFHAGTTFNGNRDSEKDRFYAKYWLTRSPGNTGGYPCADFCTATRWGFDATNNSTGPGHLFGVRPVVDVVMNDLPGLPFENL